MVNETEDLIFRLRERARIRRQISTRKSVQEGKPDKISDLLEEAAAALDSGKVKQNSIFCEWDTTWREQE